MRGRGRAGDEKNEILQLRGVLTEIRELLLLASSFATMRFLDGTPSCSPPVLLPLLPHRFFFSFFLFFLFFSRTNETFHSFFDGRGAQRERASEQTQSCWPGSLFGKGALSPIRPPNAANAAAVVVVVARVLSPAAAVAFFTRRTRPRPRLVRSVQCSMPLLVTQYAV